MHDHIPTDAQRDAEDKIIGPKLVALAGAKGMSVDDFAHAMNLSPEYVKGMRAGIRQVSNWAMIYAARALKLDGAPHASIQQPELAAIAEALRARVLEMASVV